MKMLNLIYALTVSIAALGCYSSQGYHSIAAGEDEQTEEVTQPERSLDDFDAIRLEGNFKSSIEPSDRSHITIKGDNVENVITVVEDGVLYVEQKHRGWFFSRPGQIELTIEAPGQISELHLSGSNETHLLDGRGLTTLSLSGSTRFLGDEIDSDHLEIRGSGSSVVKANGFADNLEVRLSGSSRMEMEHLRSRTASIRTSGSSRITMHVDEELIVNTSGSSRVNYAGSPRNVETSSSGSSSVRKISEVSQQ